MPQTVDPLPYEHVPAPKPIRWKRQQCAAMRDAGILTERYELIEGEIILKMGQNRPHALVIVLLTDWLTEIYGGVFVQIQLPIRGSGADSDSSEPEPDAVVLQRPATGFVVDNPRASDVSLLIEVSDSSLRFDRVTKAALYARNDVLEYWVIDLEGRQIIVHRRPATSGYTEILAYSADEQVAPLSKPDAPAAVSSLLPPLAAG